MNLYKLYSDPESLRYHDEAHNHVPFLVWDKYENNPEELKKMQDVIAKDSLYSFLNARFVIRAPFPKGEDIIGTHICYSYLYAHDVLKAPFPKGEDAIAKDAEYSYLYAALVLKGPFPKGEAVIMKSRYADDYKKLL